MFEFFALALAIVALIVAVNALNQVAALRARLEALEALPRTAAAAPPAPPPLPQYEPAAAPPITEIRTETIETRPDAAGDRLCHHHRRSPHRRGFRKPSPGWKSVSAPAGWSGSAA